MEEFVRRQNVERYRRPVEIMSEDGNPTKQIKERTILKLLAEEQQRQKDAGDGI
jgi:hypothetical protein